MIDFATLLTAGVSDDKYHGAKHVLSSTGARKLLACPARFRWECDNPQPPRRVYDFGKLAHKLVLGEGSELAVIDAADYRSKGAQEQRNAAYADGLVPVLASEYETAKAMRDAVYAHPTAAALFRKGYPELSGWFTDESTGTALRFRPDWLTELDGQPICVDLKTTINADPAEFVRSVVKFGYHAQAAWYLAGLAAHGVDDAKFYFVLAEKSPPYPVAVVELDFDALSQGDVMMRRAIDTYATCIETDTWPAYGTGIHSISLPPWAIRESVEHDASRLIAELESI